MKSFRSNKISSILLITHLFDEQNNALFSTCIKQNSDFLDQKTFFLEMLLIVIPVYDQPFYKDGLPGKFLTN